MSLDYNLCFIKKKKKIKSKQQHRQYLEGWSLHFSPWFKGRFYNFQGFSVVTYKVFWVQVQMWCSGGFTVWQLLLKDLWSLVPGKREVSWYILGGYEILLAVFQISSKPWGVGKPCSERLASSACCFCHGTNTVAWLLVSSWLSQLVSAWSTLFRSNQDKEPSTAGIAASGNPALAASQSQQPSESSLALVIRGLFIFSKFCVMMRLIVTVTWGRRTRASYREGSLQNFCGRYVEWSPVTQHVESHLATEWSRT